MIRSVKATKIMAGLLVVFCSFDFIAPSASLVVYAADRTWDESKKIMPPATQGSRSAAGIVDQQASVQKVIDELNKIPTKQEEPTTQGPRSAAGIVDQQASVQKVIDELNKIPTKQEEPVSVFESSAKTNPVSEEKLTVAVDGDTATVTLTSPLRSSDGSFSIISPTTSVMSYTGRFDQNSHVVTVDLPVIGTQMVSEQWVIQLDNETRQILGWSKDRKNKTYNTSSQYVFDSEGWVSFMHTEIVTGTYRQTQQQNFTYVEGAQGRRLDASFTTVRILSPTSSYAYETHRFNLDDQGSALSLSKYAQGNAAPQYSFSYTLKNVQELQITYVSGQITESVFNSIQPGADYMAALPGLELMGQNKHIYVYADAGFRKQLYSVEFGKDGAAFVPKIVRWADGKVKIVKNQADILSEETDDVAFIPGQTGNWPDGGTYKAYTGIMTSQVSGSTVTSYGIRFVVTKVQNGKTVSTQVFVEYPKTDRLSVASKNYTIKFDPSGMVSFVDELSIEQKLQELKDAMLMEANALLQSAMEQMQILETAIFNAQEAVESDIQQILADWNALVGSAMDKKSSLGSLKNDPLLSTATAALIGTYLDELAAALDADAGQNARSVENLFAAKRHNATAEMSAKKLSLQKYITALQGHIQAIDEAVDEEGLNNLVVPARNEEPFSLRLENDPRPGMATLIQRGEELVALAEDEIRNTREFKELRDEMLAFAQEEIGNVTTEIDSIKVGLDLARQALDAEILSIREEAGSLQADAVSLRNFLSDALTQLGLTPDLKARIENYIAAVDEFMRADNPLGLKLMLDDLFSTMTEARLGPINSSLASAVKYSDDLSVYLKDIQSADTLDELQALVKPSRLPDITGRPVEIAPDPRADLRALILEGNEIKRLLENLDTDLSQTKAEMTTAANAELVKVDADLASLASQIQAVKDSVNDSLVQGSDAGTGSSVSITDMTSKIASLAALSTNAGVSAATKNEILSFLMIANAFVDENNSTGFQKLLEAYASALIHNTALALLKDQAGAVKYKNDLMAHIVSIQSAPDMSSLSNLLAPVRGLGVVDPVVVPSDPRMELLAKINEALRLIDKATNEINSLPGEAPVFQSTPEPIDVDATDMSSYWDSSRWVFKPIPIEVDLHATDPKGGAITYSVDTVIRDGVEYDAIPYYNNNVISFYNSLDSTPSLPGHQSLYINARISMLGETTFRVKATSQLTGKSSYIDVKLNLVNSNAKICVDGQSACTILKSLTDVHGFNGFVYANQDNDHANAFGSQAGSPPYIMDRADASIYLGGLPGTVTFANASYGNLGGSQIIGMTAANIFTGNSGNANLYYDAFTSTTAPMMSFNPGLTQYGKDYAVGGWIATFDSTQASGSENDTLKAFMWSAASLRKDVFKKLMDSGTLMPTLAYIYRQVLAEYTGTDYMTSLDVHRNSFNGGVFTGAKSLTDEMMVYANSLTVDKLPSIAQIKMTARPDVPVKGVDYFEAEKRDRVILDNPLSLATVMMDGDYKQTYEVDASDSFSVSGAEIREYHWNVVQGDSKYVEIEKLNAEGSRVRITFYNHPPASLDGRIIDPQLSIMSNMIKIALIVKDDKGNLSTPSYITNVVKYNVTPEFDAAGKLLSLTYNGEDDNYNISRKKFNASVLASNPNAYANAIKRDEFVYDAQGNLSEIRRFVQSDTTTPKYILDNRGRIIVSKDALGRPIEWSDTVYSVDVYKTVQMKPSYVTYTMSYQSDTDKVGRISTFVATGVKDQKGINHKLKAQLIYDDSGNLTKITFDSLFQSGYYSGYPAIGSIVIGSGQAKIYDKNSNLITTSYYAGTFNLFTFLSATYYLQSLVNSIYPPVVVNPSEPNFPKGSS